MRRSGRTQVKLLDLPQRIDCGQGKRRGRAGNAPAISRGRRDRTTAAAVLSSTQ